MELSSEGMPRFDLLQSIRKRFLTARVVIVSAYGSLRVAVAALRKGADDYLVKPVTVPELLRAIKKEDDEASFCLGDFPSLAKVEWEYIARVLQSVEWNISAAARVLGIGRSTLQRKLRKYPPHR
jgi:two-component system response regulator RegA